MKNLLHVFFLSLPIVFASCSSNDDAMDGIYIAEAPGGIAITLNSVMGATGMSLTNISAFDAAEGQDAEAVTFDTLTSYDGYINVHLSAEELRVLVAQGNIGSNAS